jgi:hypothetical protein
MQEDKIKLQKNFAKYFDRIIEASKSWARISPDCEKEKIIFSIGYVKEHLKFNNILPEVRDIVR